MLNSQSLLQSFTRDDKNNIHIVTLFMLTSVYKQDQLINSKPHPS